MVTVGFTGTREGMTSEQQGAVSLLLGSLRVGHASADFVHGACIGADAEAGRIAWGIGYRTVAWPGPDPKTRCWFTSHIENDPMPYLARNKLIARSDVLIATPKEDEEPKPGRGQGTWSTVRYARKTGAVIYIVWPNGRVSREDPK